MPHEAYERAAQLARHWADHGCPVVIHVDARSPLYGCRTVAFVHDEFILEAPANRAPEAAERLAEVMIEGMREVVPDVRVSVEAVLCDRWHKGAKPVRDAAGRLTVWRPEGA